MWPFTSRRSAPDPPEPLPPPPITRKGVVFRHRIIPLHYPTLVMSLNCETESGTIERISFIRTLYPQGTDLALCKICFLLEPDDLIEIEYDQSPDPVITNCKVLKYATRPRRQPQEQELGASLL